MCRFKQVLHENLWKLSLHTDHMKMASHKKKKKKKKKKKIENDPEAVIEREKS